MFPRRTCSGSLASLRLRPGMREREKEAQWRSKDWDVDVALFPSCPFDAHTQEMNT